MEPQGLFGRYPLPHSDEALLSFFKRLAAVWELPSVYSLLATLELNVEPRLAPVARNLAALFSKFPAAQKELLQAYFSSSEVGKLKFNGEVIPRHYIDLDHLRFCAICLSDQLYLRQEWHLSFVHSCPRHSVRLLEHCSHCGNRNSFNSTDIANCDQCGFDLRRCPTTRAEEPNVVAVRALLALYHPQADLGASGTPSIFREMSLECAVELLLLLGRMRLEIEGVEPGKGRPLTWKHAPSIIGAGYSQLLVGPIGFTELLQKFADRVPDGTRAVKSVFGSFTRALSSDHRSYSGLVRPIFEEFSHGLKAKWLLADEAIRISVPQSDADLRFSMGLTRHMFEKFRATRENGEQGQVAADEAVALGALCNAQEMGQILGLTVKQQIKRVVDAGLFKMADSHLLHDGRCKLFPRADVERFISNLRRIGKSRNIQPEAVNVVRWRQLVAMAGQRKVRLRALLDLLAQGYLRPASIEDGPGLLGLVFDKKEAVAELDAVVKAESSTVSIREVSELVNVSLPVAYSLLENGYLEESNGRDPASVGKRVTLGSLERFSTTHVSVGNLSATTGIPVADLRRSLRFEGFQPTIALEKTGVQFYARADVARLTVSGTLEP